VWWPRNTCEKLRKWTTSPPPSALLSTATDDPAPQQGVRLRPGEAGADIDLFPRLLVNMRASVRVSATVLTARAYACGGEQQQRCEI
jgi:hypothetical protein